MVTCSSMANLYEKPPNSRCRSTLNMMSARGQHGCLSTTAADEGTNRATLMPVLQRQSVHSAFPLAEDMSAPLTTRQPLGFTPVCVQQQGTFLPRGSALTPSSWLTHVCRQCGAGSLGRWLDRPQAAAMRTLGL
jgi:hypothetical protein